MNLPLPLSVLLMVGTALACDDVAGDKTPSSPEALAPVAITYSVTTDWESIPLIDGYRVWTTSLGYEVGISQWDVQSTSLELVPCMSASAFGLSIIAHTTYVHDVSVVETDRIDDVTAGVSTSAGPGSGDGTYCGLLLIEGLGRENTVSTLAGWYSEPGTSERIDFEASHPLGLTALPEIGDGRWDETLESNEAVVEARRYPARALDDVDFAALSSLDQAYEAHKGLHKTIEVTWSLGPE